MNIDLYNQYKDLVTLWNDIKDTPTAEADITSKIDAFFGAMLNLVPAPVEADNEINAAFVTKFFEEKFEENYIDEVKNGNINVPETLLPIAFSRSLLSTYKISIQPAQMSNWATFVERYSNFIIR
jgi:hypothetical protein